MQRDLVGERNFTHSHVIFNELCHRVHLKLSLGERVVVIGTFRPDEKRNLTMLASSQGLSVIDGDPRSAPIELPVLRTIEKKWHGITVVGDLHGNLKAFQDAATWARSRHHFLWLLGDIIDYGSDTLEIMTSAYHLVMAGEAAMVMGNHERKIARWLDQRENGKIFLRLSTGNKVTTHALEHLHPVKQRQWIGQFRSLLSHSSLVSRLHDITLVHGAIHPSFWTEQPDDAMVEKYALYGEAEHKGGKYKRTYQWVNHIPKDQTVIIGHDVKHEFPYVDKGASGGQAVFLDTGCGKGGHLSSADLRFSDHGLHLECFKRY